MALVSQATVDTRATARESDFAPTLGEVPTVATAIFASFRGRWPVLPANLGPKLVKGPEG